MLRALLLAALATATGCLFPSPSGPDAARDTAATDRRQPTEREPLSLGLPLPTKDEVVLVDGRPLSITGFIAIRDQLTHPGTEAAFWVGVAALAMQSDARARGADLPVDSALLIARYALRDYSGPNVEAPLRAYFGKERAVLPAPEEARQEIERLVSHSVVQRNPQVLAEMR